MLKLIFTVCLFTFAAYLPANEQENTDSQETVQDAFSCDKHKKNKSKDTSEDALACGKHKKQKSLIQEEATEDAEPLAFFCPECTDKEDAFLA